MTEIRRHVAGSDVVFVGNGFTFLGGGDGGGGIHVQQQRWIALAEMILEFFDVKPPVAQIPAPCSECLSREAWIKEQAMHQEPETERYSNSVIRQSLMTSKGTP